MELVALSPKHAVIQAWDVLRELGEDATPREMKTVEILNYNIEIIQPWRSVFEVNGRDLNPTIGALELCGLIGQVDIDSAARRNVRALAAFQDEGISWGAYGPRIRGLLVPLVEHLLHRKDSRQAVLTIHDSRQDLNRLVKDIPCTLALQFFIRGGEVHMRTTMRSNDAWLGLPYDLMMFCGLHRSVAHWLNLPMGRYYHSVGSMHLYEKHQDQAFRLAERYSQWDPDSNEYVPMPWRQIDVQYAVEFCQDMLGDGARAAETELEEWIKRSVR